jgi:hypothetical protein
VGRRAPPRSPVARFISRRRSRGLWPGARASESWPDSRTSASVGRVRRALQGGAAGRGPAVVAPAARRAEQRHHRESEDDRRRPALVRPERLFRRCMTRSARRIRSRRGRSDGVPARLGQVRDRERGGSR